MPRKSKQKIAATRSKASTAPAAALSLSALKAELQRRQRGIAALQRKRERLTHQIEALNTEIAAMGGALDRTPSGRPRNAQTLADALHAAIAGKEVRVIQAMELVQADGYHSTAANFRVMVNQTLLRDKRFKRVRRGVFTTR